MAGTSKRSTDRNATSRLPTTLILKHLQRVPTNCKQAPVFVTEQIVDKRADFHRDCCHPCQKWQAIYFGPVEMIPAQRVLAMLAGRLLRFEQLFNRQLSVFLEAFKAAAEEWPW
jgi:hypothetical protein